MITRVTCSWCGGTAATESGVPTYCGHCGHRADRARVCCDCRECVRRRGAADPDATPVEVVVPWEIGGEGG